MSWLQVARSHRLARALSTLADSTADALHPLLVLGRGLVRLGRTAQARWRSTPGDKRGPAVFLGAACALVVALTPYGPWLALAALVCAAAWAGREGAAQEEPSGPSEAQQERLQSLYDALAPCFCAADDPHPHPLYTPDGSWEQAFVGYGFTEGDRLEHVELRYPPYFPDGDRSARASVEQVLSVKAGRDRDYLFDWDEEHNRLRMSVRPPLPREVPSQHFATAPSETVVGFTDPESVQRRLPVVIEGEEYELPPVVWRTGPHSAAPHLLAVGRPGSGTTNLLRSLALQAVEHHDVVVVDAAGEGAYAFLEGQEGVLAVESTLTGARSALQWVAHETARRLNEPRGAGGGAGAGGRPLWLVVDQLSLLVHLARVEGGQDPQELLVTPLRHGHKAHVTLVIGDQLPTAEHELDRVVHDHTHAKVVLGPADASRGCVFPGHGQVRLGGAPPLRLVVPHTPDSPVLPASGARSSREPIA